MKNKFIKPLMNSFNSRERERSLRGFFMKKESNGIGENKNSKKISKNNKIISSILAVAMCCQSLVGAVGPSLNADNRDTLLKSDLCVFCEDERDKKPASANNNACVNSDVYVSNNAHNKEKPTIISRISRFFKALLFVYFTVYFMMFVVFYIFDILENKGGTSEIKTQKRFLELEYISEET
ncbi:MAG: hypothetical protein CfP315_0663 [Candidatus Improbicoccus pseudotrichonymphae]|uniref:Uncharacterized protein n=1 Tax=Candidatus Improbicoccus pseudotrichonymphae TaxID=3033792 RepID=A0AA48KVM3_9FIRM|nr:MAG: hypothetical protein CfP315_0663 [Candidatus Improbicoccus pseudotrichonymphae]